MLRLLICFSIYSTLEHMNHETVQLKYLKNSKDEQNIAERHLPPKYYQDIAN